MSENPQFLRTDKAIMNALISLMRKKPFERITVQDILEETPVTRATFYAHYHDKYEIVERMLGQFFAMQESARENAPASPNRDYIQKLFLDNRDMVNALQKIRTEKLDFRQAVARELEQEYLAGADSPTKQIEARIYAQAVSELHFSLAEEEYRNFSAQRQDQIFLAVALRLLNLSGDLETRSFLAKKLSK